jgi:DNA-directed RNA polymerase sigma subunit (sigma70/sigma32)
MEYLSDCLKEPDDFYEVFTWDQLSTKSQNTLQRAIQRTDVSRNSELNGFSFDLLSKISVEDLNDARFVGPARAEELMQELITLFENLNSSKNLSSAASATSQIISVSSLQILAKLTVEENLDMYLERIGSVDLLTHEQRHALLQELLPSKNPFRRMMFGKKDQETALGHLIDANLRLSFALAKRVCPDREIRARTVAGNLGLLAGITSFSDKPNVDFESYVMKHVREFIQDLIGSFNLSYDDIVELMLDANESELESVDIA